MAPAAGTYRIEARGASGRASLRDDSSYRPVLGNPAVQDVRTGLVAFTPEAP